MSTHNIYFHGEIRKTWFGYTLLSGSMNKCYSYLKYSNRLTLVLLNKDLPCLCKQCRSRSLWRTRNGQMLPWWSEEAIQRHPQSLPQGFQHTNRVMGTNFTGPSKVWGLIRRDASDYEAKGISEAEQKLAQPKARAKASPTELSCSDLCCSICNTV